MSTITTTTTSTQSTTKSRPLINNPIFPWSKIKLIENDDILFPRYGHSSYLNAIQDEIYIYIYFLYFFFLFDLETKKMYETGHKRSHVSWKVWTYSCFNGFHNVCIRRLH